MSLSKHIESCLYLIKTATLFSISGPRAMMNEWLTEKFVASLLTSIIMVFLSCAVTAEARDNKRPFDFLKKTIVIDPGHGGRDKGGRGPEGTFEKKVTLALARMIASELENDYRVVLTRTGDYQLNITERTSAANHSKADLFISIHTGGSMLHTVNGRSIFYYEKPKHLADDAKKDTYSSLQNSIATPWHTLQNRYQPSSRKLAEIMKKHLEENTKTPIKIQGAPVLILEGADMPAILLEAGYLTNSTQERELNNKQTLYNLAKKISSGINEFLTIQK